MNPDRERLDQIEGDWQTAIAEIRRLQEQDREAFNRSVAEVQRLHVWREAARDAKWRTVTHRLMAAVAVIAAVVTVGFGVVVHQARTAHDTADRLAVAVADIQRNRVLALTDQCRSQDALAQGIRDFVVAAAPRLGREAALLFPLVADCAARARATVGG